MTKQTHYSSTRLTTVDAIGEDRFKHVVLLKETRDLQDVYHAETDRLYQIGMDIIKHNCSDAILDYADQFGVVAYRSCKIPKHVSRTGAEFVNSVHVISGPIQLTMQNGKCYYSYCYLPDIIFNCDEINKPISKLCTRDMFHNAIRTIVVTKENMNEYLDRPDLLQEYIPFEKELRKHG